MERIAKGAIIFSQLIGFAMAQAPTGSIAGVVHDPSGAPVAGAHVKAVSLAMSLTRTATTPQPGDYTFPALLPGDYEVTVEAPGFRRSVRRASVEAGYASRASGRHSNVSVTHRFL